MTASDHHRKRADTVHDYPRVGAVSDVAELASFYAESPAGVRVNMIFSADGAAVFGGRAGPLSGQTDQQLLKILRGFADVVLVGAATARAENYGPVQLSDAQQAERNRGGRSKPPPVAVISRSGVLPTRLVSDPSQPPLLVTCAESAVWHNRNSDQRCGVLVAGEETVDVARAVALLRAHRLTGSSARAGRLCSTNWWTPTSSWRSASRWPQAGREPTGGSPTATVSVAAAGHVAAPARTGLRRLSVLKYRR